MPLVTRTRYNAKGEPFETVDPKGVVTRSEFDALGRRVRTIQNYLPGSTAPDANITTEFTYKAGHLTAVTAVNAATGNQTTRCEYGVSHATGSLVSRNDLLRETIYPDGGLDTVKNRYNRQGERIGMTDQNGTVHAYERDKLGRMTADEVTSLGTGIDGAVRKLGTTYNARGLVEKLTSYGPTGSVVNEVKNTYNGLNQLTEQAQSHAGAVTGGTPKVEYGYDHSASSGVFTKGARPTVTIYPTSTQKRELDYGTAGEAGDKLARPVTITDGGTKRCNYEYVGLNTFARVKYRSGDDMVAYLTYDSSTDNSYSGWDRFGRIVDHHWQTSLGDDESETLDHFQYGYDANSNRLYKANLTARALDKPFDELYRYDRLNRLVDFQRGTLNAEHTAILGTPTKEQTWNLDSTGNWSQFTSADDGVLETDQTRISNPANEITEISSWFPPAYDHAGNMTKMPKPDAPAEGLVCIYDAWNRLVRVQKADDCGCAGQTVAEYAYDPQTWRTVATTYDGDSPDETRHFYYSRDWQIVEERLGSLLTPVRTHLWGLRYIDEIVHRWRAVEGGDLDESTWALQDANWNTTAILHNASLVERFAYTAYGRASVLSPLYVPQTDSLVSWDELFGGAKRLNTLFSLRFRMFHCMLGLFLTRDPLAIADPMSQYNFYEYTGSSPTCHLDPSGQVRVCATFNDGTATFREEIECVPALRGGTDIFYSPGAGIPHVSGFPGTTPGSIAEYCVRNRARAYLWGSWTVVSWKLGGCNRVRFFVTAGDTYCGCPHVDLWSERRGQLRIGLYGPPKPPVPGPRPAGTDDLVLENNDSALYWLSYGVGAGTSCRYATDAQIESCILAVPVQTTLPQMCSGNPQDKGDHWDNCRSDIANAVDSCCLWGFSYLIPSNWRFR